MITMILEHCTLTRINHDRKRVPPLPKRGTFNQ
jgi:hypothetical protein